ncbi:MAG: hypothetical protein J6Z02_02660 [Lachnospiraceae bacterium]|nr:hypothetical protein [Lachnospiraceae bacterium]
MPNNNLNSAELKGIGGIANFLTAFGLDNDARVNHQDLFWKVADNGGEFTDETEKETMDMVNRFSDKINAKITEIDKELESGNGFKRAKGLQKALMTGNKMIVDNFVNGVPVYGEGNGTDYSFLGLIGMQVQLDPECFNPERLEKTEKVVSELNLDVLTEKSIIIQEKSQYFMQNKDKMQPEEREKAYNELTQDRKELIEMAKESREKMLNPTPEMQEMFYNGAQLADYAGIRGLEGFIEEASMQIMRTDIPQAESLDSALKRFNFESGRSRSKESPEHSAMRQEAEYVNKNMKILQDGFTKDASGNKVTLTDEAKAKLLTDTADHIESLKQKTEKYIGHAEKNGRGPVTGSGKERLAGAKEIKDLVSGYDKVFSQYKTPQPQKAIDPAKAGREKINAWNEKIKAVDFKMFGRGSDEFSKIVDDLKQLKEYSDRHQHADEKGRIKTDTLLEIHEKESAVIGKLEAYLNRKEEQFKKDPSRRDDPSKQKREQPRIRAAIDILADMKKTQAERTNLIVNSMQESVRPKLEKMLAKEEQIRQKEGVSHDDYVKSTYRSLNIIQNLDGNNWTPAPNESLKDYCKKIQFYANEKNYDKSKAQIMEDKNNPGRNVLKAANRMFKEGEKLTNDQLKEKYAESRKDIVPYQDKTKAFDLASKKADIEAQNKKFKDNMVSNAKNASASKNVSKPVQAVGMGK